jgi:hypothetical protein
MRALYYDVIGGYREIESPLPREYESFDEEVRKLGYRPQVEVGDETYSLMIYSADDDGVVVRTISGEELPAMYMVDVVDAKNGQELHVRDLVSLYKVTSELLPVVVRIVEEFDKEFGKFDKEFDENYGGSP